MWLDFVLPEVHEGAGQRLGKFAFHPSPFGGFPAWDAWHHRQLALLSSDTGSVCVFSGILLVLRGLWLLFSVSHLISSMNSVPLLRVLCLELSILLFS